MRAIGPTHLIMPSLSIRLRLSIRSFYTFAILFFLPAIHYAKCAWMGFLFLFLSSSQRKKKPLPHLIERHFFASLALMDTRSLLSIISQAADQRSNSDELTKNNKKPKWWFRQTLRPPLDMRFQHFSLLIFFFSAIAKFIIYSIWRACACVCHRVQINWWISCFVFIFRVYFHRFVSTQHFTVVYFLLLFLLFVCDRARTQSAHFEHETNIAKTI